MSVTVASPVILLASAAGNYDLQREKLLAQEHRMIQGIFRTEESFSRFEVVQESNEPGHGLLDYLEAHAFDPNISVVHLSGFQPSGPLFLRMGGKRTGITPISLANRLAQLPGLQVVFLSGCATAKLHEALLLRDIPAVIVTTETTGNRRLSREIAHTFYTGLARGMSIKEAYRRIKENYAHRFSYKPVRYDLDTDCLEWPKAARSNGNGNGHSLEWGLYVLKDRESALVWRLPRSEEAALRHLRRKQDYSGLIKLIGSSLLASVLVILLLVLLDVPQKLSTSLQPLSEACVFEEDETYKLLCLPFYEGEACGAIDPQISQGLRQRLSQLADKNARPETDFQVRFFDPQECPPPFSDLEQMIRVCQANLVMWGHHQMLDDETLQFTFRYLYTSKPHTINQGEMELKVPMSMLDQDQAFINTGVEDIVNWARGMGHFERGEYEQAIRFFSQMRVRDELDFMAVDNRMAESYIKLKEYEQALIHYDHMMKVDPENHTVYNQRGSLHVRLGEYEKAMLDFNDAIRIRPDYADAFYNRGLLHLHRDEFDLAIEDIQQVLNIQPEPDPSSKINPYGVLAAIYAEQEKPQLFYSNLELALQNGLRIENYLSYYSAFRAYKNEPEFRSLVKKYQ